MTEEIYESWVREAIDLKIPENEIENYVIKAHKPTKEEILKIRNAIAKVLYKAKVEEKIEEVDVGKFFDGDSFISKRLGDEILSIFTFKTMMETDEIYVYLDGAYKHDGEAIIREMSNRLLGEEVTTHRVNEVLDYVKRSTFIKREEFDKDKYKINLKNGIFDLKEMKLLPHTPDILMTAQLPVVYDSKAGCPKIKKFLSEIVSEKDVPILEETSGYCLWKDYHIQKSNLFVGDGANGKSTFLELLKRFLGPNNVACVSLQDLCLNRFASSNLFGKLANIFADLPDAALKYTGMFKMLSGGDTISAEMKFKNHFSFVNFAKLIFSANKVPESYDTTGAFFRRWVIINFPFKFEGKNADRKILEKLTTPEELSGFFNLAVEGLKRLLEQGEFTNAITTEEMQEKYQKMSSSVGAFVTDKLEVKSDGIIPKDDLYQKYVQYCNENNLPAKASNVFAKDLPRYIAVEVQRPKINNIRTQCWVGIKYHEEIQEKLG